MANFWDQDEVISAGSSAPAPAAAKPSAGANFWDADTVVRPAAGAPAPSAAPAAPAAPQRSLGDQVARQAGLGVRHIVSGAAAVPNMIGDAINAGANLGLKAVGSDFRFKGTTEATQDLLNQAGLPQPENASERVAGDISSALVGGGGIIKAGQALARNATAPVAKAVGESLSKGAGTQLTSAGTSSAAAGVTRENGGGEGAQLAAGVAGALAPSTLAARRVVTDAGRQTRAAAQNAADQGYVIPPADLSPGFISEGLSGFSGKIKTAQVASARNQTVSNSMARKALGIGDDVDLNIDTLNDIRRTASQAYAPVAGSGTITPKSAYTRALDDALKPFTSQANSFPGARVPQVVADINSLRSPQFDAGDALNMVRSMRESADIAYRAGENQAGKAYKSAAGALENAIEDHLKSLGRPGSDLLKGFRDARQTIAKTYTVQAALNPQTGNVNAVKLAADLAKGKPLSGELRTVAEVAQAFPRANQALKEAPKATSPLDWFGGTAAAAGTGNPLPLAAVAARPAARAALLSRPMQAQAIRNAGTEITRAPEGPLGIVAGLASRTGNDEQPTYTNRVAAGAAARQTGGIVVPVAGGFIVQAP